MYACMDGNVLFDPGVDVDVYVEVDVNIYIYECECAYECGSEG